jgi:hypothetical protein
MNAVAAAILMAIAFTSVHVKLTVAESCTIKTGVSLAVALPDCHSQGVSAVLSVEKASASEDSYLATIDF